MACRCWVPVSIAVILCAGMSAASEPEGTRYELASESWFGVVCELCSCPDTMAELRGTFLLRETGEENGFQTFDVLEVHWRTGTGAAKTGVTGSGIFRQGGPSGHQQQLELDLRVGDEERHYTSGLVETEVELPRLTVQVETNLKPACRDTVFFLAARPEHAK